MAEEEAARLESFFMPANFSSVDSEFMNVSIPQFCPTLAKNTYHTGHPDLLPTAKLRKVGLTGSELARSNAASSAVRLSNLLLICAKGRYPQDAVRHPSGRRGT
jgi:hypothetical protein